MRRLTLLLALVALSVPLVACGRGESEATTLKFDGLDTFTFVPDTASADTEGLVEVTLNNEGALEHTWTLVSADVDLATVRDVDALAGVTTGAVPPGESKTISFTAPAAGAYQYVCTIPGHAPAGMVGTLTIN
jgi:nitrite reductase (NO-forming)